MQRFLFCDIDFTLLDFPHEKGMAALHNHLASCSSPLSLTYRKKIEGFVDETFHTLMGGPLTRKTPKEIEKLKHALLEKASAEILEPLSFEADVTWSRELWLNIACQQHGIKIQNAEVIVRAAQAYWDAIRDHAELYEDARNLFESIEFSGWTLVLVTNSDARLHVAEDGQLAYDPRLSKQKKLDRLPTALRAYHAIDKILVGDPIGKPHPQFWTRVLKEVECDLVNHIAIVIGDSYHSDIKGLKEWNAHGILVDRAGDIKNPQEEVPEAMCVVPDLSEILQILSRLTSVRNF